LNSRRATTRSWCSATPTPIHQRALPAQGRQPRPHRARGVTMAGCHGPTCRHAGVHRQAALLVTVAAHDARGSTRSTWSCSPAPPGSTAGSPAPHPEDRPRARRVRRYLQPGACSSSARARSATSSRCPSARRRSRCATACSRTTCPACWSPADSRRPPELVDPRPTRRASRCCDAASTPRPSRGSRRCSRTGSPPARCHGVLLDILGLGVLVVGESGIGKSECALDLVVRGHRLVADDAVEVRRRAQSCSSAPAPS
jgi:hypothetical protein